MRNVPKYQVLGLGTYHIHVQRRLRRASALAQPAPSLRFSRTQSTEADKNSDQNAEL